MDSLDAAVEGDNMKRGNRDALLLRADLGKIIDALLAGRAVVGAGSGDAGRLRAGPEPVSG